MEAKSDISSIAIDVFAVADALDFNAMGEIPTHELSRTFGKGFAANARISSSKRGI
jgi:hypothetical protein